MGSWAHGYCPITITVIQPTNILMQFSFSRSVFVHMLVHTIHSSLNSIQFTAKRKIFRLLLISLTAHHPPSPHSVSCDFLFCSIRAFKSNGWSTNERDGRKKSREFSSTLSSSLYSPIHNDVPEDGRKKEEEEEKKIVSSPKTRNEKKSDNFKTNETKRTKEKRREQVSVLCACE